MAATTMAKRGAERRTRDTCVAPAQWLGDASPGALGDEMQNGDMNSVQEVGSEARIMPRFDGARDRRNADGAR
jgi:hypothetical protein